MNRRPILLLAAWSWGCSSAAFEVGGAVDGGTTIADSTATLDSAVDSEADSAEESSLGDTGVPPAEGGTSDGTVGGETIASCPSPAEITDVYVDGKSTFGAPSGTSDCPFRHIADAVAFVNKLPPKPRKIRVLPGTYNEGVAIVLKPGIVLSGAGVSATKIAGGGLCAAAGDMKCVVRVEGGATLENVTVDGGPTGKHAIVTGGTDAGNPILKNLKATGALGDGNAGILTLAGSQIGPAVEATGNKYGLVIWGGQATKITGPGTRFDFNTLVGINHEGVGPMSIENGVTVMSNGDDGIRAGERVTTSPPLHSIIGASVKDNAKAGIRILESAGARVRGTTLLGNKFGIVAMYGAMNAFDFGQWSDSGNNVFGTASFKNALAGLCAVATRTSSLKAINNKWPSCSAKSATLPDLTGCDAATTYSDVWYRGLSDPDTSGCTPG